MNSRVSIGGLGAKAVLAAVSIALFLSATSLFSQAKDALKGLNPRQVAIADGPSGLKWIGGNGESPLMHPGLDCISCHARGEGPRLPVAGTVYTNIDEKDDYFGVEGAIVQLTDAKGKVLKLVANRAGNFYSGRFDPVPAFPVQVKVLGPKGRGENAMAAPAPSGNCASCHTAKGANGAPGRVQTP